MPYFSNFSGCSTGYCREAVAGGEEVRGRWGEAVERPNHGPQQQAGKGVQSLDLRWGPHAQALQRPASSGAAP